MSASFAIIVFDGQSAFCDRSVKWIIRHGRSARFRFTPRQSAAGQQILARNGLPPEGVESMILVEGSRVSTHSTAVLRIASGLLFQARDDGGDRGEERLASLHFALKARSTHTTLSRCIDPE
jgi:predicted DCC family thiol-disulfide oxidoreductase YuxK